MNFLDIEERDITDLVTAYESKRDPTETATRRLKGLIHWEQNQRRCGSPIITSTVTLPILTQALQQTNDRKSFILQKKIKVKIVYLGKFSNETSLMTWHDAFVNYLSVLPGTTIIPLAYVVRSNFAPDYSIYHDTFNKQLIAQAPLQDRIFLNDTSNVFQLLTSLTVFTSAEEYISTSKPRFNGRTPSRALVDYCSRVNFQRRQVATAE